MSRQFLGRGWRFPILPDSSGRLGYSEGEENVEHSLRVLLLTALGERVMRLTSALGHHNSSSHPGASVICDCSNRPFRMRSATGSRGSSCSMSPWRRTSRNRSGFRSRSPT